ncbi:hypothetical protein ACFXNW_10785 [Nocardia sp. NPDC059180]|uniref:hypothetical protein n=1 Tax=Nocardia sp. NPDC059180 TaxID=3346761 RepID=UPI0036817412
MTNGLPAHWFSGAGPMPPLWHLTLGGKTFHNGIGPQAVANGNAFKFGITNPVGSGRNLYITRLRYYSNAFDDFLQVRINPTGNLPTTLIPSHAQKSGLPAGLAELRWSISTIANGITGGTILDWSLPFTKNTVSEFDIPSSRVLAPGFSATVQLSNNAGASTNVCAALDWCELEI